MPKNSERRKQRSRDAARTRRSRESDIYDELFACIPPRELLHGQLQAQMDGTAGSSATVPDWLKQEGDDDDEDGSGEYEWPVAASGPDSTAKGKSPKQKGKAQQSMLLDGEMGGGKASLSHRIDRSSLIRVALSFIRLRTVVSRLSTNDRHQGPDSLAHLSANIRDSLNQSHSQARHVRNEAGVGRPHSRSSTDSGCNSDAESVAPLTQINALSTLTLGGAGVSQAQGPLEPVLDDIEETMDGFVMLAAPSSAYAMASEGKGGKDSIIADIPEEPSSSTPAGTTKKNKAHASTANSQAAPNAEIDELEILYVTAGILKTLGIAQSDALGCDLSELVHPWDLGEFHAWLSEAHGKLVAAQAQVGSCHGAKEPIGIPLRPLLIRFRSLQSNRRTVHKSFAAKLLKCHARLIRLGLEPDCSREESGKSSAGASSTHKVSQKKNANSLQSGKANAVSSGSGSGNGNAKASYALLLYASIVRKSLIKPFLAQSQGQAITDKVPLAQQGQWQTKGSHQNSNVGQSANPNQNQNLNPNSTLKGPNALQGLSNGTCLSRHSLDMKFAFCDQKLKELLVPNPEAAAADSEALLGRSFYSFVHPEDLSQVADVISSLYRKEHGVTGVYRFLSEATGQFIYVQSEVSLLLESATSGPSAGANKSRAIGIICVHHLIAEGLSSLGLSNKSMSSMAELQPRSEHRLFRSDERQLIASSASNSFRFNEVGYQSVNGHACLNVSANDSFRDKSAQHQQQWAFAQNGSNGTSVASAGLEPHGSATARIANNAAFAGAGQRTGDSKVSGLQCGSGAGTGPEQQQCFSWQQVSSISSKETGMVAAQSELKGLGGFELISPPNSQSSPLGSGELSDIDLGFLNELVSAGQPQDSFADKIQAQTGINGLGMQMLAPQAIPTHAHVPVPLVETDQDKAGNISLLSFGDMESLFLPSSSDPWTEEMPTSLLNELGMPVLTPSNPADIHQGSGFKDESARAPTPPTPTFPASLTSPLLGPQLGLSSGSSSGPVPAQIPTAMQLLDEFTASDPELRELCIQLAGQDAASDSLLRDALLSPATPMPDLSNPFPNEPVSDPFIPNTSLSFLDVGKCFINENTQLESDQIRNVADHDEQAYKMERLRKQALQCLSSDALKLLAPSVGDMSMPIAAISPFQNVSSQPIHAQNPSRGFSDASSAFVATAANASPTSFAPGISPQSQGHFQVPVNTSVPGLGPLTSPNPFSFTFPQETSLAQCQFSMPCATSVPMRPMSCAPSHFIGMDEPKQRMLAPEYNGYLNHVSMQSGTFPSPQIWNSGCNGGQNTSLQLSPMQQQGYGQGEAPLLMDPMLQTRASNQLMSDIAPGRSQYEGSSQFSNLLQMAPSSNSVQTSHCQTLAQAPRLEHQLSVSGAGNYASPAYAAMLKRTASVAFGPSTDWQLSVQIDPPGTFEHPEPPPLRIHKKPLPHKQLTTAPASVHLGCGMEHQHDDDCSTCQLLSQICNGSSVSNSPNLTLCVQDATAKNSYMTTAPRSTQAPVQSLSPFEFASFASQYPQQSKRACFS